MSGVPKRSDSLTPAERRILALVALGLSNQEIADRLTLSERTIRTHVSSIIRKLRANNRMHAVMLAMSSGLLSIEANKTERHWLELFEAIERLRQAMRQVEALAAELTVIRQDDLPQMETL